VLRFDGLPAEALFHADCGGHTSASAAVWGGHNRPYLLSRADEGVAADAHATWQYIAAIEAVASALDADARTQIPGKLEALEILNRDDAGRAERIAIRRRLPSGIADERVVRGEELRQVLSRTFGPRAIRSTWFDVRRDPSAFTFSGRGFGHGVGLCQAGALARLRAGATPSDVMAFYYPGTALRPSN
jgi:stage II sporulation protein D